MPQWQPSDKSHPFFLFFFLLPKSFWADINLARQWSVSLQCFTVTISAVKVALIDPQVQDLKACSRHEQHMFYRLVTQTSSKCHLWHPLWHRTVTSATGSEFCAVLQARPSKEGWDVLPRWEHSEIDGQWCCRHLRAAEGTGCTQKGCWWISAALEIISSQVPSPMLLAGSFMLWKWRKCSHQAHQRETLRCFSSGRSKGRMIYCSLPLSHCPRQGTRTCHKRWERLFMCLPLPWYPKMSPPPGKSSVTSQHLC